MTHVAESSNEELSYIIYDRVTGMPIGRHRHFDVTENRFVKAEPAEVLALYAGDSGALRKVTNGDAANLAVIESGGSSAGPQQRMQVVRGRLVPQPSLVVFSDHRGIEGNGKASTNLTVLLQDASGQLIHDADHEVLVTTSRGKLSARGGRLRLKNGQATLTLTSVAETVQVVRVRVQLVDGTAQTAETQLAFV